MTLDTRMYVLGEVDPREVFAECQKHLSKYDTEKRTPEQQITSHSGTRLANRLGQGLPAILDVSYRDGGPYRTAEMAAAHEHCNHPDSYYYDPDAETCTKTEHEPACWLEVSWDTAYGYRGPGGTRCGDLHAMLIVDLGRWLDARGIAWKWLNEYTSEVHDDYASLDELISNGAEASEWFRTKVMPAISAHAARGEQP